MENQKLKYFWAWLFIGYLYLAYIVYASLTPNPVQVGVEGFDKVAHFAAYALLMIWFGMLYYTQRSRVLHASLFVALGVGMEFVQAAGGVRYFEVADMIANSLGVLAGFVVTKGCGKFHLLRIEQALLRGG